MEAEIAYMNTTEIAQTINSTHLELAYERAVRQAERIYEEERVRALRVQLLLLQDDNGELQEQALQSEDVQNDLEEMNDELRAQFSDLEAELQQTQMDLKSRNRDLDHVRAEVNVLNAASAEATKLLSEKLALAREINALKTELEHLRSQTSIQQNLLAEKLALQREVNSLQVELETEKRTVQRIKAQEKSAAREDSVLTAEIEQLRKELAKTQRDAQRNDRESSSEIEELKQELAKTQRDAQKNDRASKAEIEELKKELGKAQRNAQKSERQDNSDIDELKKDLAKTQREAQKTEREHRKKATQWESEKEILEGKLDAFRNKLRSTKDQLTAAQDEVEQLQAMKMAQAVESTKARLGGATAANPRKRNVARFDPDMTIGTPGQGGPAAKKQRGSVSLSDKSTFSITPFLNRTLSILPETPGEAEEEPRKKPQKSKQKQLDATAEETDIASDADTINKKPAKLATTKISTGSTTKAKRSLPLKETTNSKANTTMKKPQLAKLIEEDSDMESEQDQAIGNGNKENDEQPDHADIPSQETLEISQNQKVSKRTNIFDEEDSASIPKVRSLGRGGGALGKMTLKAKPVGKGKTLAEFSPLKRDRRAASVL